ncbi:Pentatricopeptide repeat-containing protein [Cinnamomum micranthum f. kanehirae]|uniref:Pentatricopeptide repeat-containing protein n=1 Tax=Cinnamomum micranthum f. kanehirae TaxID=337451 RepID=A0A3S3PQC5_9MAGN|nr:Pentatricopeptide repeat-containing protein [Cinnamomum micranthum f. kanehirae]
MANAEEASPLLNPSKEGEEEVKGNGGAPPKKVEDVEFSGDAVGWTADGLPLGHGSVIGEPVARGQWDSGLFSCLGRNDEFCSSDLERQPSPTPPRPNPQLRSHPSHPSSQTLLLLLRRPPPPLLPPHQARPPRRLRELLRQNHCLLALTVFSSARREPWYRTDYSLYAEIISALARNGMPSEIDRLVADIVEEGFYAGDSRGLGRLLRTLVAAERPKAVIDVYELMKRGECVLDEFMYKVLTKGLRRLGEIEVADEIERDYASEV